jgi:hypothetical protein
MEYGYAIQNTSGQWWTGTCWGAKESRQVYARDELPSDLPVDNLTDDIRMKSYEDKDDMCLYYDERGNDGDEMDAIAVYLG